jgi:head-tail adaptor
VYPGKYPLQAVFYEATDTEDAIGNHSREPVEVGRTWVAVEPVNGREFVTAGGDRAEVSHRIRLQRPTFDVPSTTTIVAAGRTFTLLAPLDAPGGAEMVLMCAERRA